ncbi:MAG: diacylglycerol kinase family lipid kinase [Candidatus Abyssubacteria bacterium]
MNPRYLFIINPFSGAGEGEAIARTLQKLLGEHPAYRGGMGEVIRIDRLEPERLSAMLFDAEVIIIGGGDGTVNSLLARIIGCPAPPSLALIPLGTSNDLARALGVPVRHDWTAEHTLQTLLDSLPNAPPRRLDVLGLNDALYFCNYFSIGLDAAIVRDFDYFRDSRWASILPPGRLVNNAVYFLMGLRNACFSLTPPIEILMEQGVHHRVRISRRVKAIIVSNLPVYAGGCTLHPQARVDDGLFEITVVANAYQYVRIIATRFLKFLGPPRLAQYQAGRISLRMNHPSVSQVDGEKGPLPESLPPILRISVRSSISVLIPTPA